MATYSYLTINGTVVPDTAAIQADVEQEWVDALGLSVAPDPSSDEGRLIDAEITSRISVARNNALLANQLNPNLATGTFLDAQLALVGSERDGEEQSTVQMDLTGVASTVIAASPLKYVEDDNKNLWFLVSDATLDGSGDATATFRSVEYGPITASSGTITKIVSGVVGWETANNPADASPGKLEQTDVSARRQRKTELGSNALNNTAAIISAVSALEGVNGVKFLENFTGSTDTFSGVSLVEHSTWICVDGGVDEEIAEAYFNARSGGSDFNGDEEVVYVVPISEQEVTVKFDRPDDKPLICRITAVEGVSTIDDIKNAAILYVDGLIDGYDGFTLGEDSSPFEIASGINAVLPNVFVSKVELATVADGSGSYSTDTIVNAIYEKASLIKANIEVI